MRRTLQLSSLIPSGLVVVDVMPGNRAILMTAKATAGGRRARSAMSHHVASTAVMFAASRICPVRGAAYAFTSSLVGFDASKPIAAVMAAIASPWSNGQTEGQITKLKLVKRRLYGRAKIGLLEAWLLSTVRA